MNIRIHSSISLKVSRLPFRSLIHLELISIQDERRGTSFIIILADTHFFLNTLKILYFLQCVLVNFFFKHRVVLDAWHHIWVLDFVLLINATFFCQYHGVIITVSL